MRFDDLLRISLRQVVRQRRRYLGMVLSIAIGVAGFISIITMGQDVKKNFNENLALIGDVTIIKAGTTATDRFSRDPLSGPRAWRWSQPPVLNSPAVFSPNPLNGYQG